MNDGEKHGRLVDLIVATWSEPEIRSQVRRMGLAASLPGSGVSLHRLADEFVDLLKRRGRANTAFFERLAAAMAPTRWQELIEVSRAWGVITAASPHPAKGKPREGAHSARPDQPDPSVLQFQDLEAHALLRLQQSGHQDDAAHLELAVETFLDALARRQAFRGWMAALKVGEVCWPHRDTLKEVDALAEIVQTVGDWMRKIHLGVPPSADMDAMLWDHLRETQGLVPEVDVMVPADRPHVFPSDGRPNEALAAPPSDQADAIDNVTAPGGRRPRAPTPASTGPRIFISYVRLKDAFGEVQEFRKRLALELGLRLDGDPAAMFLDTQSIAPGQEWEKHLELAVSQASAMVVLLSPAFLKRDWCRREVVAFTDRMAAEGKVGRLFPVRWIATPSRPDDKVQRRVEAHQAVDWTGLRHESWTSAEKLRALSELADAVAAAVAPLPPTAREPQRPSNLDDGAHRALPFTMLSQEGKVRRQNEALDRVLAGLADLLRRAGEDSAFGPVEVRQRETQRGPETHYVFQDDGHTMRIVVVARDAKLHARREYNGKEDGPVWDGHLPAHLHYDHREDEWKTSPRSPNPEHAVARDLLRVLQGR